MLLASKLSPGKRTLFGKKSVVRDWIRPISNSKQLLLLDLALASGGTAAVVWLHPAGSSLLNGCGPTSGALSRRRVPPTFVRNPRWDHD